VVSEVLSLWLGLAEYLSDTAHVWIFTSNAGESYQTLKGTRYDPRA
jgi:hypothetical protein